MQPPAMCVVLMIFLFSGEQTVQSQKPEKQEQGVLFYLLTIQRWSSSTRVWSDGIPCLVPCTMAVAILAGPIRGTKIPPSPVFMANVLKLLHPIINGFWMAFFQSYLNERDRGFSVFETCFRSSKDNRHFILTSATTCERWLHIPFSVTRSPRSLSLVRSLARRMECRYCKNTALSVSTMNEVGIRSVPGIIASSGKPKRKGTIDQYDRRRRFRGHHLLGPCRQLQCQYSSSPSNRFLCS